MGYPIKTSGGKEEFGKLINTTHWYISNGTSLWHPLQFDVAGSLRGAEATVNAIGGPGPWGFTIVQGGDYWFTASVQPRPDSGGTDGVLINWRLVADGTPIATAGAFSETYESGNDGIMSQYSFAVIGLSAGQFIHPEYYLAGHNADMRMRSDTSKSFFTMSRVGDTP